MSASIQWHGACYGFEGERDKWESPKPAVISDMTARPEYDSMTASEYLDTEDVLQAKAVALAGLLSRSKCSVLSTGAGLSTSAGIADYASQAPESLSGVGGATAATTGTSPFLAQPTDAHRVLLALCKAGHVYRWVQQNHDGLPQKAGVPQEIMNEIHGAWHAPDNPVIPMSGTLRTDLFEDMAQCADSADLSLAIGTSICGLNVDRLVTIPAQKAAKGEALGTVIIGLQRTVHDESATLRVFARCDDFFQRLAQVMALEVPSAYPKGEYFIPVCAQGKTEEELIFSGLRYNAAGTFSEAGNSTLDVREDAELVITRGMHAGARGIAYGYDREGNVRCRFKLKPERGKLRAQVALLLGRWWLQAAVDSTVQQLPVVNVPAECTAENGGMWLQELMDEYAK
jgi:NAD-dependent SIR2 family protein deacetylase